MEGGGGLPLDVGGGDEDLERAAGAFGEGGAGGGVIFAGGVGVVELEGAVADDGEAVVEVRGGGEGLGAEAGGGVIDFNECDGSRGAVGDGGVDVGGSAADCEKGEKNDGAGEAHKREHTPGAEALLLLSLERPKVKPWGT